MLTTHPADRRMGFSFTPRMREYRKNDHIMTLLQDIRSFPLIAAACLWLVCTAFPGPAVGQETVRRFEVDEILISGNDNFGEGTLKDIILTKETPGGFSQFLYRTLGEKLGSKPELFDPETFTSDQNRLLEFYRDNGYYNTVVTSSFVTDSANERVAVRFAISEQARSYVDTVLYRGLDSLTAGLLGEMLANPVLQRGMPYMKSLTYGEIDRVLNFLANNGYPAARFDDAAFVARRYLSSNNVAVHFAFDPGARYTFGDVNLSIDPPREDITDGLIMRELEFAPGDLYSREKMITSERNLNRIGLFETARVEQQNRITPADNGNVPMRVFARPLARNELAPEIIVSDENHAFNLGLGLGYTNRNFFGDARTFNARVRARTQDIHQWNLGNVFGAKGLRDPSVIGTAEIQFQIVQPYIFRKSLSGNLTTTLSAEKQNRYILSILRNKLGLSNQFATYTFGLFEWTLERVNPEIIDSTGPEEVLKSLRLEDQPQFNSIFTLTLQRDKTNDIFSPTEGFFHSITLEESGILPQILKGIRGNLPFTQYYKVSLTGRWYRDLTTTRYNILALKLKTGYQSKYGESRSSTVSIPLNRRFFAGGSGSVRGWKARDLGAMTADLIQFGGNLIVEGSAEMRVNYFRGFGKLGWIRLENLWGVYFLDVGNVWPDLNSFRLRDLAVAAGIGLRYETFFGPFRFDYGFRLYDPGEQSGKETIFKKRFFGETLNNGVIHFGIGHAF